MGFAADRVDNEPRRAEDGALCVGQARTVYALMLVCRATPATICHLPLRVINANRLDWLAFFYATQLLPHDILPQAQIDFTQTRRFQGNPTSPLR